MSEHERLTDEEPWPDGFEFIRQLRDALGMFSGAMPISPKQAWEDAISEVKRLRTNAGPRYNDCAGLIRSGMGDPQ